MFSMAVLAAMTTIAMEMVAKVAGAFWGSALLGKPLGENFSEGMSSIALQQGGMGLILTTPPMAAMFFQGTLGSFMAYSQIGGSGVGAQPGPQGQPPGAAGSYTPPQTTNSSRAGSDAPVAMGQDSMPRNIGSADSSPVTGKMGNANRD
jgi:type IV secretion system protein VirB6